MTNLDESKIEDAIIDIIKKIGNVKGENALQKLIKQKGIKVSLEKIRRIAFHSKRIKVEVKFGKGKLIIGKKCPICGSDIEKIISLNLEGKKEIIGYKCSICKYDSSKHGKPYLYVFRLAYYDF